MKRILLLTLVFSIAFGVYAQQRVTVPKDVRNHAVLMQKPTVETNNFSQEVMPAAKAFFPPEEEVIGNTYFDLQSNSSMQSRIHVYDDGTVGAVFTIGFDFPNFSGDRGTGYNYYDGNAWGDWPTERLEADRTGWCAYDAWGDNGEINVIHYSGAATDGVVFSRRDTKGTGDWTQWDFHAPDPAADFLWPRMATGGINHDVVHYIGLTKPVANQGAVYQGLDGAILYSRSEDGGTTWSIENIILDGMTSAEYTGFAGDTYEIIADGDNVAILNGESWVDLMLMKSTDGGDTWTKTVIWENPYPLWNATPTDTFYCADGAHHLAFDQSGKVHVVFGINRAMSLDGTANHGSPV
ncbi:MAG: sialidase family protein [Bacteroidales bacterium]